MPEYVSTAFRIAKSGTPGPVYLECPADVLLSSVDESEVTFPENTCSESDSGMNPYRVGEVVDMLMKAERPVIVAGDGVFWTRADRELRQFAELAEIPVQGVAPARGAVPEDHPLNAFPGATAMADVILALGVKFDFLQAYGQPPLFDAKAKVIQVNIDGTVIGFNRGADIGVVADRFRQQDRVGHLVSGIQAQESVAENRGHVLEIGLGIDQHNFVSMEATAPVIEIRALQAFGRLYTRPGRQVSGAGRETAPGTEGAGIARLQGCQRMLQLGCRVIVLTGKEEITGIHLAAVNAVDAAPHVQQGQPPVGVPNLLHVGAARYSQCLVVIFLFHGFPFLR